MISIYGVFAWFMDQKAEPTEENLHGTFFAKGEAEEYAQKLYKDNDCFGDDAPLKVIIIRYQRGIEDAQSISRESK